MALVRGACPHDCPDTCAFHVDGRGRPRHQLAGRADHPITAGFLCGKVSDYLERVYSPERAAAPADPHGREGRGRVPPGVVGRGAGRRRGGHRDGDRSGTAPSRCCPTATSARMGVLQGGAMADRFMAAIGASKLVRTICASRRRRRARHRHRPVARGRPRGVAARAAIVCWGWNPMSTAPHLWRLITMRAARGAKLVVVDPFRSRTARVADQHLRAAARHRRRARARHPARAARRGPRRRGVVPRERASATTSWSSGSGDYPSSAAPRSATSRADDIRELAREIASEQPSLIRLGVGAQRHAGAPIAYRTVACIPALAGSWRHRGGGLSYIPRAATDALDDGALAAAALQRGHAALAQHVAARRGADRPRRSRRPSRRWSSGTRTRPRSRPIRTQVLARPRAATTCTRSCSSTS